MSITLYTPSTGFQDLEIKIAYGLARVGIEACGVENVKIIPEKGFYIVSIKEEITKLNKAFNIIARRILMSDYVPRNTPGITGRSATVIQIKESENFDIGIYTKIVEFAENKESEKFCQHKVKGKVSNVLGFTASATTGVLCKRDGIDIAFYDGQPRRPTDPRDICKTCGLLALLGTWYATFIFSVADREIIAIPIPKNEISGSKLQEIFALQHQIRKDWFKQEIPQVLVPIIFLSKIPSSADILYDFELFVAVLSRQQGYHVDGLLLIPIENYLNFIEYSPYNVATIDMILSRSAFTGLTELNKVIYNKDRSSILKFARLYVQETSTNNYTNLLYPETAKYLLKEVAMIKEEIIRHKAVRSIAKTLGYFVWNKDYQNYSFADGLRNAKTFKDVRQIFEKLEREAKLRYDQEKNKQNGNLPHLPHPDDIEQINHLMQMNKESFEQVITTLYLLAFSFESYKTIKIEPAEEVQNEKQNN
jgi:CRISPR type I-A-associated protein Csa5